MERSIRQIVIGNSLDATHGRMKSHLSMLRGTTAWRIDPGQSTGHKPKQVRVIFGTIYATSMT
jgi:hypothetical protein